MIAPLAVAHPGLDRRLLSDPIVWRLARDLYRRGWHRLGDRRRRTRTYGWRLDAGHALTINLVPGYADVELSTPLGRILLHAVTDPGYAATVLRTALHADHDLLLGIDGPYRVEAHPQASGRWQVVHTYPTESQARTEAAGIARHLPGMPIRIVGPDGPQPA